MLTSFSVILFSLPHILFTCLFLLLSVINSVSRFALTHSHVHHLRDILSFSIIVHERVASINRIEYDRRINEMENGKHDENACKAKSKLCMVATHSSICDCITHQYVTLT